MSKYLVFLDIDGVFTSTRVQYASANPYDIWNKFDETAVNFMNKLHDLYDVKFILMSTWKREMTLNGLHEFHWILSCFRNCGFRGEFAHTWKTNPYDKECSGLYDRAYEVKDYLIEHAPDCLDYLLFDDTDYGFNKVLEKKRFIQTSATNGLLFEHMQKAMSITGVWDKK